MVERDWAQRRARELLWLERKEGYAEVFLQSFLFEPGDVMIVFSHGGMNAAGIETALYAKKKGLTVISVSSLANAAVSKATHSSGKMLPDVADIAIDNCVAPEDSQVDIGRPEKVAAGSTMAVVFVAMSLVAETGARLIAKGFTPTTFVSPNVAGIAKDHNEPGVRSVHQGVLLPHVQMTTVPAVSRIHTGWLSASAFSGMFGFGIVMALLGAILPMISLRLRFDLAQAGDLFLVMNATMLVGTFALGPLLDRFGIKLTFVIAPLFVAGALLLIANASSFAELRVAIVLLGIGGGALNQATNTLIADLHEDERRKSSALNLLGVFFGFGALSIPFTIGALLGVLGLTNILYCATALVLVTTLISLVLVFPAPTPRRRRTARRNPSPRSSTADYRTCFSAVL